MQKSGIILDKGTLTKIITKDGFMRAKAAITRPGVIEYTDQELGIGQTGKTIRILRTDKTVFNPETIDSVRGAAVTIDHPAGGVTPDNYKDLSVGSISGEPARISDNRLGADILIGDKQAIKLIESGDNNQLSIGYSFSFDESDNPDYDYVTTGALDINHVALVKRGRAGENVRIFDSRTVNESKLSDHKMNEAEIKKVVADALKEHLPAATTDKVDYRKISDSVMKSIKPVLDEFEKSNKAAKDAKTAAQKAEAEAKAVKAADTLVMATIESERKRAFAIADCLTMIPEANREAAKTGTVRDAHILAIGDSATLEANSSDDYVAGVFSAIKKARDNAVSHSAISNVSHITSTDSAKARDEMVKNLTTAYLGDTGKKGD